MPPSAQKNTKRQLTPGRVLPGSRRARSPANPIDVNASKGGCHSAQRALCAYHKNVGSVGARGRVARVCMQLAASPGPARSPHASQRTFAQGERGARLREWTQRRVPPPRTQPAVWWRRGRFALGRAGKHARAVAGSSEGPPPQPLRTFHEPASDASGKAVSPAGVFVYRAHWVRSPGIYVSRRTPSHLWPGCGRGSTEPRGSVCVRARA